MPGPQVFPLVDVGGFNVETALASTDPTPTVDYTGGSARLVIKLQNWFATLSRSDARRYNAAEQNVEYPDDRGLDFAPSMAEKQFVFIPRSRLR